jgi:hypothetical protein
VDVLKRCVTSLIEYLRILIVLATVSAYCAGCIWLAVPGLAYEGYKYEQQLKTLSSTNGSGRSSNSEPASRDRASSDHSIE